MASEYLKKTFWREVLEQSTLLDIETAGLDPSRHTPIAAATKRYGVPGTTTQWFAFETSEMTPEAPFRRRTRLRGPVPPEMEPWPAQQWKEAWGPERARYLRGGGRLQKPSHYFSGLFKQTAEEGGFLWAHNVHFDISSWGSQYAKPEAMRPLYEGAAVEPFYPFAEERSRLWPTQNRGAFDLRRTAKKFPATAPGAMRGWYGEYREMVKGALKTGKPTILDSMFITEAMFGMAQERGAMGKTLDVTTGARLGALHEAFGLGRFQAHMAGEDIEALERVMPHVLETTERLYKGKGLSGRQREALFRLGRAQPEIARRNIEATFAQAQTELREAGKYRYYAAGGEQVYSTEYRDILAKYEELYGKKAYEGIEMKPMWERMAGATREELELSLTRAKQLPTLGRMEEMAARGIGKGGKMLESLAALNPTLRAGLAVGAGALLLGAILPTRRESNTIEGLSEDGLASQHRKLLTDFGSGYINRAMGFFRGPVGIARRGRDLSSLMIPGIAGLSVLGVGAGVGYALANRPQGPEGKWPERSKYVHPEIREFRESVWRYPEKRKRIQAGIKAKQAAYQAKLGRLESDDFLPDLPILESINYRRGQLRAVNLAKFRVNAEDADTIMLERRGVIPWLKARFGYGQIPVRLGGIDAPEVAGHRGDPLAAVRWRQEQPYGAEATDILKDLISEQDNLQLITGAEPETYGRYIGALGGDEGANINIELLRRGAAKALPWGRDLVRSAMAAEAETSAMSAERGIWGIDRYWRQLEVEETAGRPFTFNVLTRMDLLASRSKMAMEASYIEGYSPQRFGSKATWGEISGFDERGLGGRLRKAQTDFGSGWMGAIGLPLKFVSKFLPQVADTAAIFVGQETVQEMLAGSKRLLRQSQLAKRGKGVGIILTEEETKQAIRATRQLQETVHRKEGARIVWDEVIRTSTLSELKKILRHEGLHEAIASMDLSLQHAVFAEGRVPMEFLDAMREAKFNLPRLPMPEVESDRQVAYYLKHKGVRPWETMSKFQKFHWRRGVSEEYFAYQFGEEFGAIGEFGEMGIAGTIKDLGLGMSPQEMERLKMLEKQHRLQTLKKDRIRKLAQDEKLYSRMRLKTMSKYAPDSPPKVKVFDSPHLSNSYGEGMVQRIFRTQKGSDKMYQ